MRDFDLVKILQHEQLGNCGFAAGIGNFLIQYVTYYSFLIFSVDKIMT